MKYLHKYTDITQSMLYYGMFTINILILLSPCYIMECLQSIYRYYSVHVILWNVYNQYTDITQSMLYYGMFTINILILLSPCYVMECLQSIYWYYSVHVILWNVNNKYTDITQSMLYYGMFTINILILLSPCYIMECLQSIYWYYSVHGILWNVNNKYTDNTQHINTIHMPLVMVNSWLMVYAITNVWTIINRYKSIGRLLLGCNTLFLLYKWVHQLRGGELAYLLYNGHIALVTCHQIVSTA